MPDAIIRVVVRLAALAFGLALLLVSAEADDAKPLKGVALVIGQAKYERLPALANPTNDANAMAKTLQGLGFEVTEVTDLNLRKLTRTLGNFADDAQGADAAVIYYSGHGIEAGGENWLIPTDADVAALDDAGKALVPLSPLLDKLKASVPVTLMFLDACRSNPFPAGAVLKAGGAAAPVAAAGLANGKGVVAADAGSSSQGIGMVIGFAAEPGHAALDGPKDGNSPYAAALLRHLAAMNGEEFGTVMRLVTEEVYLKTQGEQRPWVNETLTRLLYFGGKPEDAASDDGKLNAGRRALLLSIDGLSPDLRKTVERLAKDNGVPLDPLYAMLKQLDVDTSAGPDALAKQLQAGAEEVKKLVAQRNLVAQSDPEIIRISGLADRAEADGALALALDYRKQASARAEAFAQELRQSETQLAARHLEIAATFSKEGETAALNFDHAGAAGRFARAAQEAEAWDAGAARNYRWLQADELYLQGDLRGDMAALQQAIDLYHAVLAGTSAGADPAAWAELQNDLGNALLLLGENRESAEMLTAAVSAYEEGLAHVSRSADPKRWTKLKINLSNALRALGKRQSGTAKFEEALAVISDARDAIDRTADFDTWAVAQTSFAATLEKLGERETGGAHLEQAIAAYRELAAAVSRDDMPFTWATAQFNLGNALETLGERRGGTDTLRAALEAYQGALAVWTRDRYPLAWAEAQSSMGTAFEVIGERETGTEALAAAVAAFRAALEERRRDRVPQAFAATQNNLGVALAELAGRQPGQQNLHAAIAAYQAALTVWTKENDPYHWGAAQNNLGTALKELGIRGDGTAELEAALAAFENALSVRDRESDTYDWMGTQNNIGNALIILGERRTGTTEYKLAIAAFKAALSVIDRQSTPYVWASTENNYASALLHLGERDKGTANLKAAIAAFQASLEFLQRDTSFEDWVQTKNNLCWAWLVLGAKTRDADLVRQGRDGVQEIWDALQAKGNHDYDSYYAKRLATFDKVLHELTR